MLKRIFPIVALAIVLTLTMAMPLMAETEANPPGFHPQLVPEAGGWSQAFATAVWTIIIFLIMLIILYPTAWKAALASLKAREERIRNDITQAELAHSKAQATLEEYNKQLATAEQRVQEMIAAARADGERLAMQIRTRAQEEAEENKERALRDIEQARKQALAQIYEQTADLATDVARKILKRNLNPADQRDLVTQSLEQLQTV